MFKPESDTEGHSWGEGLNLCMEWHGAAWLWDTGPGSGAGGTLRQPQCLQLRVRETPSTGVAPASPHLPCAH